jgi:hypothetical protein
MALTQRQGKTFLDDLQHDAIRAAEKLAELVAFVEQLSARIENVRWGGDPTEQRRDKWVKVADVAPYQPKAKRK